MLTPQQEVDALHRASHECAICFQGIAARQRVRASREVLEGRAKTFHFCTPCCLAMARRIANGHGAPYDEAAEMEIELRYELGRSNSATKQPRKARDAH